MMQDPIDAPPEPDRQSTTHLVHVLLQFALAVRHRKNVVILALVVCTLLGGLYYATATRYYSAKAQLLVMQSGSAEVMSPSLSPQGGRQQSLMPTYETLLCSAKVLDGALAYLRPEDRIDLADLPRDRWTGALQKNLVAETVRDTNIIEIEYKSKDPAAAVAVVNAVVQSYLEFMDRTHKGTAIAIIGILSKERTELAQQLMQKEYELQAARAQVGGLAPQQGTQVVHPLVKRAIDFNEALIEAQKHRLELEASLAVVDAAVRNGEDLQQAILSVADAAGRDMLLSTLGFSPMDISSQAEVERTLLADKANLVTLEEHLGPRHPQVASLVSKIRLGEQYLFGYQDRIKRRIADLQGTHLGPMLVTMLRQQLNEARQHEAVLDQRYQQAMAEAGNLNDQLAQIEILEHDLTWLRDLHDVLLKRIADLDMKHEGPDIRTAIVSEPLICTSPVSPSLKRVALLVLTAGISVGLMLVYVLDTLDDRFRSVEEMQQQLGAPVLTMIRPLPSSQYTGLESLQVYSHPDASESEAFRTLRTALSLSERPTNRLVVTSSEPGDGKTTVLANLAVSYAQAEKKTLLIDADLRRPGLSTLLGLRGIDGLSMVIRGEGSVVELAATYIRASGVEGLDILPAGTRPSDPAEVLANPRFAELLSWAETVYDRILIDTPPTLAASDTAVVGRLCDGAILVVQPEKNRRRLVLRAADSLTLVKIPLLGVVINRVAAQGDHGYYGKDYGYDYHYGTDEEPPQSLHELSAHEQAQEDMLLRASSSSDVEPSPIPGVIVPRRVA